MNENLSEGQFASLIKKVFQPKSNDRVLTILLAIPNREVGDNPSWRDRRLIAFEWKTTLTKIQNDLGLEKIELVCYENVDNNNADLPETVYRFQGDPTELDSEKLVKGDGAFDLHQTASEWHIVLAPTQFSATAPLKNLARQRGFRAASMPGFHRKMIPALQIDYEEVHQQVMKMKTRLDEAIAIKMKFEATGKPYQFSVDTRHRTGHASSGLIREPGTAWNLPSGEAFIVPYEGELGEPSKTYGSLPVQFGDEIVVYKIEKNRAVEITSEGETSKKEREKLLDEPAYGNIAEIGFGVLQPFGIKPIGEMLLDEKLGLHIAFGRSDHFGGATSPEDFGNPQNVIHIDRIYIPEVQDRVEVKEVVFEYSGQKSELIIKSGEYVI
ncbi:hypothetical protein IH922_09760 [candidate division KSB1 bacterium]|nr:hypothetical protein [candidate division KSB1 bacterium]